MKVNNRFKILKQGLCIFIILYIILSTMPVLVFANSDITITLNPQEFKDKKVTISGKISSGEGKGVTLLVLKPTKTMDDLTQAIQNNALSFMEIVEYISQTKSTGTMNNNGIESNFSFKFELNNPTDGLEYVVFAGGLDAIMNNQNLKYIKVSNAEKVNSDKNAIEFPPYKDGDTSITLPDKGKNYGSLITWDSSNTDVISIDGNIAKITQPTYITGDITITATITLNNITETRIFPQIKVKSKEEILMGQMDQARYVELGQIINSNNDFISILKVKSSLYNDYIQLSDKDGVHKQLAIKAEENPFKNIDNFIIVFDEVVKNYIQSLKPVGGGSGRSPVVITNSPSVVVKPIEDKTQQPLRFEDIDNLPWAKESIEDLTTRGVISGFSDNKFRPDDKVTREQFIKMLVIAFGLHNNLATATFSDIEKGSWYYTYIASAQQHEITNGVGDGTFGVGKEITRQEMATLAYRVATYAKIQLPKNKPSIEFADRFDIGEYATSSITAMQQAGIISGVGDNIFAPNNFSTRAESAKVIYELLQFYDGGK